MSESRQGRTRWKGKNASAIAKADPISGMYEAMKAWEEAPCGLFANSAVLLQVSGEQVQLLSRACFGRSYPPPAAQPPSSTPSYPPPFPEEGLQLFQLGLEEAFYLNYDLRCINVYAQTAKGKIMLGHAELWRLMQDSKKHFLQHYKAYSHLRSKRWVVLSGIQYGADFMAYRHHPALVHSDYAVLVMFGEADEGRLSTWTDLHSMLRLCGSVAKTLLLVHITPKGSPVDSASPVCLDCYNLEAVEVERWIPEKHREITESADNLS